MSLKDKAQFLADLQKRVPKNLEARMDEAISRLSTLEGKNETVFDPLSKVLDEHEAGIAEVEEAVNMVERGVNGPRPITEPVGSPKPSDDSSGSLPKAAQLLPLKADDTVKDSPQHELIRKTSNG